MTNEKFLLALGKRIKEARAINGFSQEEIAFRALISTQYLSQIERGKRNIGILNLKKIAKALNIELWELIPDIKKL